MDLYIDIEQLRKDLMDDSYGALFGGGFGGALFESFDIEKATPDELVEIARRKGIDLSKYSDEERQGTVLWRGFE